MTRLVPKFHDDADLFQEITLRIAWKDELFVFVVRILLCTFEKLVAIFLGDDEARMVFRPDKIVISTRELWVPEHILYQMTGILSLKYFRPGLKQIQHVKIQSVVQVFLLHFLVLIVI